MIKAALSKIMQQMEKAQEELVKINDQLENEYVEASTGGGLVTVVANARKQLVKIKFDTEALHLEDAEMLEELILEAVNQALEKAGERAREEMQKLSGSTLGGLKLPGFMESILRETD